MRIEYEVKLGFKDVLIRPKRSTLKSRSELILTEHIFSGYTQKKWTGIPIIAANMDTVGTFAMAKVLARYGLITALHKHYSIDQWRSFMDSAGDSVFSRIMVSTGTSKDEPESLSPLFGH